jgi:phosphoglycerate dehydrogenase-like enzyme
MENAIWSQWDDLTVPTEITKLSPANFSLDTDDLSQITFYVPQYMGGRKALEYVHKMPNLKYLQVPNAGFDDAIEFLKPGVVLCNARGVHDASTAELAVALALASRRGFHDFAIAQSKSEWAHKRYPSFNDSKIGIIGAGSIANTLKSYLEPYEVEISMFSRSGQNGSIAISELISHLPKLDFVFIVIPLNEESRNLFDSNKLSMMKDGAVIVNVGRGPIINTEALLKELNSGRIYAGLDVTDPEPLPSDHPLWKAKNLIITPHVGGNSTAFESRGKRLIESQLELLSSGQELNNIVARG